jgi:hypothetical protein
MGSDLLNQAVEMLEKANAGLQPELLTASDARELMGLYSRVEKLGAFGKVALARKVDDAVEIARIAGTSIGKAKETVSTGVILGRAHELNEALKTGEISFDQAAEIAKAEESAPGSSGKLLTTARNEPFHVLKEKARKVKLEADQHHDLAARQHAARTARTYTDELGMIHIHLAFEPHIGAPIVARAEAAAARLVRAAKNKGATEPFERHAADAYAQALSASDSSKGRARRPELVVLVSYEVAKRGWTDVRKGEICKIPGIGPVPPEVAREIANDAFLNGVFYDGRDLRQFARWTRHIPVEVAMALELGAPPSFDGVVCVDCGNRFRTEFDHVRPHSAKGPTSNANLQPRCWSCHQAKTAGDRKKGKLRPPEP